jgi:putative redox protein
MSTPGGNTHVVTVEGDASGFAQRVTANSYTFSADEPVAGGGTGTGPDPYQLLLAALGTCKSMTAALYARRKQWPLTRVRVELAHSRVWSEDCESCLAQPVQLDRVECAIEFSGDLTDAQRARLVEIADRCPVHRTLTSQIHIVTTLA